jgi:hypothetical protein
MIDKQFTPEVIANGGASSEIQEAFLKEASARELQRYLRCKFAVDTNFHQAKIALDIRLAEDAAETAAKMSQHTAQLVKESISLTALTRQLKFWTIMLGVFAVVQIAIMVFEYLKH